MFYFASSLPVEASIFKFEPEYAVEHPDYLITQLAMSPQVAESAFVKKAEVEAATSTQLKPNEKVIYLLATVPVAVIAD
jgi:hypothetical protein